MFGLAGALVLGFLDLTAGQAQNRFFNELEEWLAGLTRLSSGALGGEGEASVPVYVQALLEQTAENMEDLQRDPGARRGRRGTQANQAMLALTDRSATLSDTMRANQQLMLRIAEAQAQLAPALQRLGERRGDDDRRGLRARICATSSCLQRLADRERAGPRTEHRRAAQRHPGPDPHHRRHRRRPAGLTYSSPPFPQLVMPGLTRASMPPPARRQPQSHRRNVSIKINPTRIALLDKCNLPFPGQC